MQPFERLVGVAKTGINDREPEASVAFLQHHKVVLSTEGKVEGRKGYYRTMTLNSEGRNGERTNNYNPVAVVYNTAPDGSMSLVEIHFADSNKVLVFNQ